MSLARVHEYQLKHLPGQSDSRTMSKAAKRNNAWSQTKTRKKNAELHKGST